MQLLIYSVLIISLVYWVERPGPGIPNFLIMRKHPGDELDEWLKRFQWNKRQEMPEAAKLPSYKFYSEVVEVLLHLARRLGGNYQESLLFLRTGLQTDRQFERKIKEATRGIWFQMGLMMILTWGFILLAMNLVEVEIKTSRLGLILLWQCVGMGILPWLIFYLRKKYFGDIGKLWKMLFVLKSLVKVPLSRTEILTLAGIQGLSTLKQPSLMNLVNKLKESCQQSLKLGTCYEQEVTYLMEELRFQEKWHFELFEKKLTVIKLGLLSLFFLPSYLAFIFLLLGDLMTLM